MAENKEVDVNEQIKNRMEKLSALQAEGNDPFEITKYDVTCHTSDIKDNFDECCRQKRQYPALCF